MKEGRMNDKKEEEELLFDWRSFLECRRKQKKFFSFAFENEKIRWSRVIPLENSWKKRVLFPVNLQKFERFRRVWKQTEDFGIVSKIVEDPIHSSFLCSIMCFL